MTESSTHAKLLYPGMPLCIGYLRQGTSLNFVTSLDSDYTSLGYIQEKFPIILQAFEGGEWYIDQGKIMSFGPVCYIKSFIESEESFLEIPLSQMELFEKICGEQRKRCKMCKVYKDNDQKMKKCAGCFEKGVAIFYCSEMCQKKDWKKGHKNDCLTYVSLPNVENEKCSNCESSSHDLKKCAGCHLVSYCSRECQKEHWKGHKAECGK